MVLVGAYVSVKIFLFCSGNSWVLILKVYFYTTLGCHLCEQAAELLRDPGIRQYTQVEVHDIADSDSLIKQYGEKIPVLLRLDTQEELCWPFDKLLLKKFIEAVK